jgi:hypothetical protein
MAASALPSQPEAGGPLRSVQGLPLPEGRRSDRHEQTVGSQHVGRSSARSK